MDQQPRSDGSPTLSSEALVRGHDSAGAGAGVAAGAGYRSTAPFSSIPSYGASISGTRPRRSWDTALPNNSSGEGRCSSDRSSTGGSGCTGAGTDVIFRPKPANSRGSPAVAAEVATAAVAAAATGYSRAVSSTEEAALRNGDDATGMSAMNGAPRDRNDSSPADGGLSYRSSKMGAGTPSLSPNMPDPPSFTSARAGGVAGSDDDLTDTDENVMARLTEFTEIARRTAVHNEELSRELAAEKRRVAQTARKLEQSNMTSMELRESLALAQDTVMRLREHEMAWAERTASEMSLRSEMCALKDDLYRVSGDNAALKKRCHVLQRENTELGERFAAIAEEKRQVESKARRLLRSDRYRGY